MADKPVHHWVCTGHKNAFFRILGHFGFFVTLGDPLGPLGGKGVSTSPYQSLHLLPQKIGTTDKSIHHCFTTAQISVFSLLKRFLVFLGRLGPSRGPLGLLTHQKVTHCIALCSKCHDTLIYKRFNACLKKEKLFTLENYFNK